MQAQPTTIIPEIRPGCGRISVSFYGTKAILSELSATYPLKLLSPHIYDATAVVYLLTYGGGLVGGDEVQLIAHVGSGANLLLLSQGTTKVFKVRPGVRLASLTRTPHTGGSAGAAAPSKQQIEFNVARNGTLLLLPEPVTCFRDASYDQIQKFNVDKDGSVVILDWITSGRISMGEEWAFSRYYSSNEVWYDGQRIAKDVMLLEDLVQDDSGQHAPNHSPAPSNCPHPRRPPTRTLKKRLAPYSCYAMLIICGPRFHVTMADLVSRYEQITVFKMKSPPNLIWSLSPINSEGKGVVIRAAGIETEVVKGWLKEVMSTLEPIIGKDAYRRVFA